MKRAMAVTLTLQDHGLDVISYMIHRVSKKTETYFSWRAMLKAIYLFFSWIIEISIARGHQQDCRERKSSWNYELRRILHKWGKCPKHTQAEVHEATKLGRERTEGSVRQVTASEEEEVSNNRPWPRSRRKLMILIATLQGVIDPKPYQGNQKQRDCHYKQAPNSTTLNNALQFTSGGMWHPAHRDHPPVKLIGLRVTNVCKLFSRKLEWSNERGIS